MTLVLRKLLSSSTFAIAGTFEALVERLKALRSEIDQKSIPTPGSRGAKDISEAIEGDFESLPEMADEWADLPETTIDESALANRDSITSEIEELVGYGNLATSITVNAKGQALLVALEQGFKKLFVFRRRNCAKGNEIVLRSYLPI